MTSRPQYDAAIITVIQVELQAIKVALGISNQARVRNDGVIYYEAKVYSRLLNRELSVIVTCIGEPSQASASARTERVIADYDPALIILVGIAAGMRDKLRIGDVIVPKTVVDITLKVVRDGREELRPVITDWASPVKQMMAGFEFDEKTYQERCRASFGAPIPPPSGQEEDFATHVTFSPIVADNALGTDDDLLKASSAFDRLLTVHQNIRAAEMEAGGLIKACKNHHPPRTWLVVRGISDFGDEFKHDGFHRLASCSAATWVRYFLEDGLDVEIIRPLVENPARPTGSAEPVLAVEVGTVRPIPQINPVVTDLINTQIERLSISTTSDRQREFEAIREEWRASPGQPAIDKLRTLKGREDWTLIGKEIRAKILRLEALLLLSLQKDVPAARELRTEALKLDPDLSTEVLDALIEFQADPRVAFDQLDAPKTQEGWNLRLGLLAVRGEWTAVLKESEKPPPTASPDSETRRLRALALLHGDRLKEARTELTPALEENPQWFHLRFLDAVLVYFESLSDPLFKGTDKNWPEPADPTLINRDRTTLDNLNRAERILGELHAISGLDPQLSPEIEGWLLACLGNNPERQNEARVYCTALLEKNPRHHVALAWAMARGYPADLSGSIDALFTEFIQS